MSLQKRSILAAIAANAIFGLSFMFSKLALNVTEPVILLCCRFFVTLIVLNLLVFTRVMKLNLRGKNIGAAILVGFLQPVLYFLLESYGLEYTTASFTGIIASISPVVTAILGVIFLGEKPSPKQWCCIGLSIVGVLMISLEPGGGSNTLMGCACLLGAYLVGSVYSILIRKLSSEFTAFELTYVMFTVGFLFFMISAFMQYGSETFSMIGNALSHKEFLIGVLYLGALASVGAFMMINFSFAHLPVTQAMIFGSFATIISTLAGVFLMNDPFTLRTLASFVLIFAGVTGVNIFTAKKEVHP